MFGRKKDEAATQVLPAPALEVEAARDPQGRKGAPTPSRKEQEAARKRPLVPNDRAAARVAAREARREEQLRQRRALDTGDERFLPFRDKGPQKRFARDFVDARFSFGEYIMFAALAIVISTLIMPDPTIQVAIFMLFWVLAAAVVIDAWILSRQLKKRITAKFGSIDPGVIWYGTMRALQFRRLRLPKPQVKRGDYPS